jgi:hypothetical protein
MKVVISENKKKPGGVTSTTAGYPGTPTVSGISQNQIL